MRDCVRMGAVALRNELSGAKIYVCGLRDFARKAKVRALVLTMIWMKIIGYYIKFDMLLDSMDEWRDKLLVINIKIVV